MKILAKLNQIIELLSLIHSATRETSIKKQTYGVFTKSIEPFVNSEELSSLLSCAKYKINRLADQGFIPFYKDIDPVSMKPRKLFRVSEVIKIIEATRQNGHLLDETIDRQLDPIDEDFRPRY
jgi:hypothetical protein